MLPAVNVGRFLRLCPECWTWGRYVAGRDLLALLYAELFCTPQLRVSSGTYSALCNTVICSMCIFFFSKDLWNFVITRVFGHRGSVVVTFELFHLQPQYKLEADCKWMSALLAGSKPTFFSSPKASQKERWEPPLWSSCGSQRAERWSAVGSLYHNYILLLWSLCILLSTNPNLDKEKSSADE